MKLWYKAFMHHLHKKVFILSKTYNNLMNFNNFVSLQNASDDQTLSIERYVACYVMFSSIPIS